MRRLTLLSVLLAFGACGEVTQPAAPEATEVNPPAPSFNFTNGPVHPGNSVVFRGGIPAFWIGTDPARDLLSVNGLGTLEPSEGWICDGAEGFDIYAFQDAVTSGRLVSHGVIENPTQHIYEGLDDFWTQWFESHPCVALMLPRVAEGIGDHFRFNTNCSFTEPCGKPTGTDGVRARGKLTDLVNGGQVRYTEVQRIVFTPQTGEWKVLVENIRLTPIGKP